MTVNKITKTKKSKSKAPKPKSSKPKAVKSKARKVSDIIKSTKVLVNKKNKKQAGGGMLSWLTPFLGPVAPMLDIGMEGISKIFQAKEQIREYNQLQKDIDDAEDLYKRCLLLVDSMKESRTKIGPLSRLKSELEQLKVMLYDELKIDSGERRDIAGFKSILLGAFRGGISVGGQSVEKFKMLYPDWYRTRIESINKRITNTLDIVNISIGNYNSYMLQQLMSKADIDDEYVSVDDYVDEFDPTNLLITPDEGVELVGLVIAEEDKAAAAAEEEVEEEGTEESKTSEMEIKKRRKRRKKPKASRGGISDDEMAAAFMKNMGM